MKLTTPPCSAEFKNPWSSPSTLLYRLPCSLPMHHASDSNELCVLSGFGDGMSLLNSHSSVTVSGSGSDIMGMGMNENRVDYPSSATAATSVLPFALEGVFFKVWCKL